MRSKAFGFFISLNKFYFCFFVLLFSCGKGKEAARSLNKNDSDIDLTCAEFDGCLDSPPISVHPSMSVMAYPTLASRIEGLKRDLDKIAASSGTYSFSFSPAPSSLAKYFSLVFGGNSAYDVKVYLNERMKYVVPEDVDVYDISYSAQRNQANSGASVLANNSGLLLWFLHLSLDSPVFTFIGNNKIPVTASRVGIIQIGNNFWSQGSADVPAARLATLIHEGRHSDCTGGLSQSVLSQFRTEVDSNASNPLAVIGAGSSCGHLHSNCPNDHPSEELRGKAACDSNPWGAYAIETIFSQAVAQQCTNCSSLEKQVALISGIDSKSRLIPLSGSSDLYERMRLDQAGAPNMTSIGVTSP